MADENPYHFTPDMQDRYDSIQLHCSEAIDLGKGLDTEWVKLVYKDPPEDLWGRIWWYGRVVTQMILSTFTFPAALGAFLLEEGIQSMSMGGYMLSTAKRWKELIDYTEELETFIDTAEVAAKNMAYMSPITGGAVMMYMESARKQAVAFKRSAWYRWQQELKTDEKQRLAELEAQIYGSIRITSTPSQAEIWLDDVNMEHLTPQTYKRLNEGEHTIQVRYYSKQRDTIDIWAGTISITPGKHKEIRIHIPETITGDADDPDAADETDTSKLPLFLTAEITGDIVKDGDTFISVSGEIIRLIGVDTPELGRPYASEAAEFLQNSIEDKQLTIKIQTDRPFDIYGRTLGEVRNYKGNINVALLAAGLARQDWFDEDKFDRTRYSAAEELAKSRKLGIWKGIP